MDNQAAAAEQLRELEAAARQARAGYDEALCRWMTTYSNRADRLLRNADYKYTRACETLVTAYIKARIEVPPEHTALAVKLIQKELA